MFFAIFNDIIIQTKKSPEEDTDIIKIFIEQYTKI